MPINLPVGGNESPPPPLPLGPVINDVIRQSNKHPTADDTERHAVAPEERNVLPCRL